MIDKKKKEKNEARKEGRRKGREGGRKEKEFSYHLFLLPLPSFLNIEFDFSPFQKMLVLTN